MNTKLVIVVRKDLNMRKGKLAAQVGHAVQKVLEEAVEAMLTPAGPSAEVLSWLDDGLSAKVVVGCKDNVEFDAIIDAARDAGLAVYVVTDVGKTEFAGVPTRTCVAIGPDLDEKFTGITDHLGLL